MGYRSASSAAFYRENDSTLHSARVTHYHRRAPSEPRGSLNISVFLCHGVCFPSVPLRVCTLLKNDIYGAKAHAMRSLQEHFWQSGMQEPPGSLEHPSVRMLLAVGEDNQGAWRHAGEGLAPRYHDLVSRVCAFGRCVLFSENEGYLVHVSSEPTVLAVLLSWGLLPCLESLKVMGMEVEEGNRRKGVPLGKWWFGFGWKLVLSD